MTESDERQNLPEPVQQSAPVPRAQVLELPVTEFEGEFVRIMHGKLPGETLQMDYGYRRGTHLKIELEVEVIRVSVDEKRSGRDKGDLIREHTFALREAKIVGAYTADEVDPGVGGSLAASAQSDEPEWVEPFADFVSGETEVLDFEGAEVPERLQDMLTAYAEKIQQQQPTEGNDHVRPADDIPDF